MYYRVPPFLASIEDPRAAQGGGRSGSLKGCPVCGGKLYFLRLLRSILTPFEAWVMVYRTAPNWKRHSGGRWLLIGQTMEVEEDIEAHDV